MRELFIERLTQYAVSLLGQMCEVEVKVGPSSRGKNLGAVEVGNLVGLCTV